MSLITTLVVKNSHILDKVYLIFLKRCSNPTWKLFIAKFLPQWKDPEHSKSSKINFSAFLRIGCSNFILKLSQRPEIYKHCQNNQSYRIMLRIRIKKITPETIIQKIFETNSSFYMKWRTMTKVHFLVSRDSSYYWQNLQFGRRSKP